MEGWMVIAIALSVFSNIAVIKWKVENDRLIDGILDGTVLVLLGYVFMGTISGLTIGSIASSMFSIFLLYSPPKLFKKEEDEY